MVDAAFSGDGQAWLACWAEDCIWDTPAGFADNVTEGVPAVTVTAAVCATVPPGPAQVSVKLEFAVRAPELWVPEVPLAPVHEPVAVAVARGAGRAASPGCPQGLMSLKTDLYPLAATRNAVCCNAA